jgi:hypothetical protein
MLRQSESYGWSPPSGETRLVISAASAMGRCEAPKAEKPILVTAITAQNRPRFYTADHRRGNALETTMETTMLRTYKKTLTVAVTAIALATASLAATSDAFAKGGGGGGWGHHHHGFGGFYVGGGGSCWVWVRGVLVNICY